MCSESAFGQEAFAVCVALGLNFEMLRRQWGKLQEGLKVGYRPRHWWKQVAQTIKYIQRKTTEV